MVTAHMILYIGNPKDSREKLVQLRNNFSKVAGCKINMQKSIAKKRNQLHFSTLTMNYQKKK